MVKTSRTLNQTFQFKKPTYSEVTRCILSVSDPVQIIIFGSHVHGNETPESDLDILVVFDEIESTRAESIRLRRALRRLMYPFDIIVSTPQQLDRFRNTPGLIYQTILNEGEVIYERSFAS